MPNLIKFKLSLFAIICFLENGYASDCLTIHEVDEVLKTYVKGLCPEESNCLPELTLARLKVKSDDTVSILNFIYKCKADYIKRNTSTSEKAEYDFFHSKGVFKAYLEDGCFPVTVWKDVSFYYHAEGAQYFLHHEDYDAAERHFIHANSFFPERTRPILSSFIAKELYNLETKNLYPHITPAHFSKAISLYQKVRKIQEFNYDNIDNIALAFLNYQAGHYKEAIKLGEAALNHPWPSEHDPCYRLRADPLLLQSFIASAHYECGQLDMAKKLWQHGNQQAMKAQDLLHLATICAIKKEWKNSHKYFIAMAKQVNQNDKLYFQSHEAFSLIETLIMVKSSRKVVDLFIEIFMNNYPSISKDVECLRDKIHTHKREEVKILLSKAISTELFMKVRERFSQFDQNYKELWVRASKLNNAQASKILKKIDHLAEELSGINAQFEDLYKQTDRVPDIKLATSLFERYNQMSDQFLLESKSLIKLMGSLKRSNKKSAIERQVDLFTQPLPLQEKSLKAEIIKEQKQRLKTIEQKNQLTELKQEQRKQKRKELQESYQEGPSTSTNSASPTLVETSYIKSFKNDSDKTIWETKNSHPYPSTVILLLDALNKSPSMFHLRRNLTSGSSLERLKGNRNGQLSLRINDQWRLCFTWHIGVGAYNVEIVDYH